jgi:hypothetical protein
LIFQKESGEVAIVLRVEEREEKSNGNLFFRESKHFLQEVISRLHTEDGVQNHSRLL